MFVLDKYCYEWRCTACYQSRRERRASRTRQLPTCMDQAAVSGLGYTHAVQECDEMRRCGFGGGEAFIGNSLDFRSTLDFILTAILGPSAPRLGTPSDRPG